MPGVEKAVAATLSNFQAALLPGGSSVLFPIQEGRSGTISRPEWVLALLRSSLHSAGDWYIVSHLLHSIPRRQGFEDPSHPFCDPQHLGLPQLS